MAARFLAKDGKLYIEDFGKTYEVLKAYENKCGMYWYLVRRSEDVYTDSVKGGTYAYYYTGKQTAPKQPKHKADILIDTKWYGYVQDDHTDEWGYISEKVLHMQPFQVWQIPPKNLPFAGQPTRNCNCG